jgi:hypothetical protein
MAGDNTLDVKWKRLLCEDTATYGIMILKQMLKNRLGGCG